MPQLFDSHRQATAFLRGRQQQAENKKSSQMRNNPSSNHQPKEYKGKQRKKFLTPQYINYNKITNHI